MANKVYQIRYYGIGEDMDNITAENLCSSSGLISQGGQTITNIEQVSIEATPGTAFYLNGVSMMIGVTGVYEVFLGQADIVTLFFNTASIEKIKNHNLAIKQYNDENKARPRQFTPLIVSIAYNG